MPKIHRTIYVEEPYQTGYTYTLSEPEGKNFDMEFRPDLTPEDMLRLGVFGGDYFQEIPKEFPIEWFEHVRFSKTGTVDASLNYYGVNASQPLSEWQKKGWIYPEDPKGWFLWYCRYYMGRRIPEEDARQIKRWKQMKRHISQIRRNCLPGDMSCRPKQRQALLHWAYDSRKL